VTNHRITDEASFRAVSETPREVSALYFYLQLDCLTGQVLKVAGDFVHRPHLYTEIGDGEVVAALARLRYRSGSDERVPSQEQRDAVYRPVFGQTGESPGAGDGDFPRLRDELLAAAGAFAERVYDTGVAMLRERVRTTHRPLREYLNGVQGDSLRWSTGEALTAVTRDLAYPILRNRGVCSVFGVSTPPRRDWPYAEDANADKVVEEISRRLAEPGSDHAPLTREAISNRQRAALRGAEALATVLDFSEDSTDDDLDELITRCYTWGSALRSAGGYRA
jgi:hypothetical protein